MRFVLILLTLLALSVFAAMNLRTDVGYVLIRFNQWSIETSAVTLGIGLVIGFILIYLLTRFILRSMRLPAQVKQKRLEGKARRARKSLVRGLIEINEGKWLQAEKSLTRHASGSETPLLHYLSAARAAQLQHAPDRRDAYLKLAHDSTPDAKLAVGLTQAELQLVHGQLPQALATLNHLSELSPNHPYVLKLLVRLHQRLQDWPALAELLPQVKQYNVFSKDEYQQIAQETYSQQLEHKVHTGDSTGLQNLWDATPRRVRDNPNLVRIYAKALHQQGRDDRAATLISAVLKKHWDEELALLYGQLSAAEGKARLSQIESWLKLHGNQAALLLTAGRVCHRHQLWGKARSYLEESLAQKPSVDAYQELGQLLEKLEEPDAALAAYRNAAALSDQLAIAPTTLREDLRTALIPGPTAKTAE